MADVFADRAGGVIGEGHGSNRRGQKANLLGEFVPRSSIGSGAPIERGSSLFIKRVADLEEDAEKPGDARHFKNAAGQNIEMSDSSPFQD